MHDDERRGCALHPACSDAERKGYKGRRSGEKVWHFACPPKAKIAQSACASSCSCTLCMCTTSVKMKVKQRAGSQWLRPCHTQIAPTPSHPRQ
eukprot:1157731-Pelagomonas_calceolata.AAC.7